MKEIKEVHYKVVQFEKIGELRDFLKNGGHASYFPNGELLGVRYPLSLEFKTRITINNSNSWVDRSDLKKVYGIIELA